MDDIEFYLLEEQRKRIYDLAEKLWLNYFETHKTIKIGDKEISKGQWLAMCAIASNPLNWLMIPKEKRGKNERC